MVAVTCLSAMSCSEEQDTHSMHIQHIRQSESVCVLWFSAQVLLSFFGSWFIYLKNLTEIIV